MPRGPRLVRTASATALAASMLASRTSFFLLVSLWVGARCACKSQVRGGGSGWLRVVCTLMVMAQVVLCRAVQVLCCVLFAATAAAWWITARRWGALTSPKGFALGHLGSSHGCCLVVVRASAPQQADCTRCSDGGKGCASGVRSTRRRLVCGGELGGVSECRKHHLTANRGW